MKFVIGLVVLLLVLVGGAYGMAKAHMLPVASIAKSSPAAKSLLADLKLLPPAAHKTDIAANAGGAPPVDPLADQKLALATELAQVEQEKADLARKIANVGNPALGGAITPTAPQMVEIYEAMGSDDLAALFAKQPDSAVVSALIAMDTKKAAKALAAMPAVRQVKITAMMNRAMATPPSIPQQPAP
jgi:hypothetical protein